ncbi:MAG: lamin tail domain-containing protein [Candidatus Bathyarchaeia archaeon]
MKGRLMRQYGLPSVLALTLLAMFFTSILFTAMSPSVQAITLDHVVINEYEQNPPGGNANKQWVEIYNPTATAVNISLWQIKTKVYGKKFTFPMGTILKPNSYLVVDFPGIYLSERNEQLTLLDSRKIEVDKTPKSDDRGNDDRTWQRHPNGVDTGSDGDWKFRPSTKWFTNGGETLTCNVSPNSIQLGTQVTVSGLIEPKFQTFIKVQYREAGGSWNDLAIAQSTTNGEYAVTYTPTAITTYEFRALTPWESGAVSNTATLTVNKFPSNIYILALRDVVVGDNVSIIGFISPLKSGETVQLRIGLPNGTEWVRSITTRPEGYFNHTFQADLEGTWNFTASWNGDGTHLGATSTVQYLTVKEKFKKVDYSPMVALAAAAVAAGLALVLGVGLRRRAGYRPPPTPPPSLVVRRAPKPAPIVKVTPPKCLFCKSPTIYVPERKKYYCRRCKMYL